MPKNYKLGHCKIIRGRVRFGYHCLDPTVRKNAAKILKESEFQVYYLKLLHF